MCTFTAYSLYAWLIPAVIVAGALALDLLDVPELDDSFRPHYGHGLCWIMTSYALLLFLGLPAGILIFTSVVLYIIVLGSLCSGPKYEGPRPIDREPPSERRESIDISTCRNIGYLGVAIIMGASWACALTAVLAEVNVLWYAFISLHTLQGLLIYGVSVCNARIFRLIKSKGRVRTETEDRRRNGAPLYFSERSDSKVVDLETSI